MTSWVTRSRDRRKQGDRPGARHRLVRVTAPHFVAGLVLDESGHCIEAPPILAASIGKTAGELARYFERRGWQAELVN
jgi:hypothetical protein